MPPANVFYIILSGYSGALLGNKVRCPFHGACFNVMTGDIEEFPGLDCLPSYKVIMHLFSLLFYDKMKKVEIPV